MSFKLLKSPDNSDPLPIDSTVQQRIWRSTWSFNLHNRFPLSEIDDPPKRRLRFKRMMQKYFGKKVLYLTTAEELSPALVSRAKLLKYVEIEENKIYPNRWKYKGNLVNFGARIKFRGDSYWDEGKTPIEKIVKYCEKAEIMVGSHLNLQLLDNMLSLKDLQIQQSTMLKIDFLGRAVKNMMKLETLQAEYIDVDDFETAKEWWIKQEPPIYSEIPKKLTSGFFSSLHKLRHLKKMKFGTNYKVLEKMESGRDLEKFYSQPLKFNLLFEINVNNGVGENSNLNRVLGAAEFLSLKDYRNETEEEREEIAKRKEALGIKNSVEIYAPCFQRQRNHLELSEEEDWDSEDNEEESEDDEEEDFMEAKRKGEKYTSPLLTTFCQIKERCHSLKYFSLYFSTLEFSDIKQIQNYHVEELVSLIESLNFIVEKISNFKKLKQFELMTIPDDLELFNLGKILSNKSLEVFKLQFSKDPTIMGSSDWDDFLVTVTASGLKELYIKFAQIKGVSLFGGKLFNYVQKLDNLEVIELVNENLEMMAFDYLERLVVNLLEKKKNIRKILICASVRDFETEVVEGLENRIKLLKDLQLEEIFVGKLNGGSSEYVLFSKEAKIVEKVFWSEKEMERLWDEKIELGRRYKKVFELLRQKEMVTW